MTVEDYAWMLYHQNFACALCLRPFTETRMPHVDHDHKIKPVTARGMLDTYCNYRFLSSLERGGLERARRAFTYLGWTLEDK